MLQPFAGRTPGGGGGGGELPHKPIWDVLFFMQGITFQHKFLNGV